MNRYWISWQQPGDDPRPVHFPPKETRVLGWWESGLGDGYSNVCALVAASAEWTAKAAVAEDWPESVDAKWRFVEAKSPDWLPGDRFPLSDWMRQRTNGVLGRDSIERAADFLEQYAAFIHRVKPDEIEEHPYLPELEQVAADLRAHVSGVPPTPGFTDTDRVNGLDKRLREDAAHGFEWNTWSYDTDKPIRHQLDASMHGDGVLGKENNRG
jgi:hypothetical protein